MTDLKDILRTGKAPNEDLNVSVMQGLKVEAYFTTLLASTEAKVEGLFINTTESGPTSAEMIPLVTVEPFPPGDSKWYLQLKVSSSILDDNNYWAVSQFVAVVESQGLEIATREYLAKALLEFPVSNYLSVPITYQGIVDQLSDIYVRS